MRLPTLLLSLALVSGLAPADAAVVQSGSGPDSPWASRTEAGAHIRLADGSSRTVTLPATSRLQGLADLRQSALLSVVTPSVDGQRAQLLRVDRAGAEALPPLPGTLTRIQDRPRPLLRNGNLAGAIWLAGPDWRHLEVRVAGWENGRWSRPTTLSRPLTGSQMALSAVTLADGRWLAVWSRFDGGDDEIVWSLYRADAWSAPRTVLDGNQQPDVTPSLLAMPDGTALLAWSGLRHGDYRVLTSRFDGTAWTPPAALPGRGAVDPGFVTGESGTVLLYASTAPRRWIAARIDQTGRMRATAVIERDGRGRPHIEPSGDAGLRFSWPADQESVDVVWRVQR